MTYLLAIILTLIISKFMYVLPVHLGSFFVTIIGVMAADVYALLWVFGKKSLLNQKFLKRIHLYVGHGLVVLITSGAIMATSVIGYLLTQPGFIVKMGFVLALIINSFVIAKHMLLPVTYPFKELPNKDKIVLFVSGLVSFISWVGAFIAAHFLGF